MVVAGYVLAVIGIGAWSARKARAGREDYLLAGRTLTLPFFVATLVSTWYGGILGVGEFSYAYGISNWMVLGFPYYLFAFLYAFLLAGRIRSEEDSLTIPDRLEKIYGRKAALFGGWLAFLITTPAPYVLILGVLLEWLTGWPLLLCVALGTALTLFYLYRGGFRADVWVDGLEFVLMFAGMSLLLVFSGKALGGIEFLKTNLPESHLAFPGKLGWGLTVNWYLIALWTFVDPGFHQRCSAARHPAIARRGIGIAVLFWFLFDGLTTASGLYARAAFPDLSEPVQAYPRLASAVLPAGLLGVFWVGMLATAMSTLNSLALLSAMSLGKDVWARFRHLSQTEELAWVRRGLVGVGIFSILLSWWLPSVVGLWYVVGASTIPGLLLPVLSSYLPALRTPAPWAYRSMVTGWGASTLAVLAGGAWRDYAIFPGLLAALALWGAGWLRR